MPSLGKFVCGNASDQLVVPVAVLSALDASDEETVTLEVDADERGLRLALGPVRGGSSDDDGLIRVLSRLVDDVAHESRDGSEWLTLGITRRAP